MKQFRDMLAEKEVFFGEGGKRYFIVLRNRYLAGMNLLPCNLAVLNILNKIFNYEDSGNMLGLFLMYETCI